LDRHAKKKYCQLQLIGPVVLWQRVRVKVF